MVDNPSYPAHSRAGSAITWRMLQVVWCYAAAAAGKAAWDIRFQAAAQHAVISRVSVK
jgi:hypothetical protein